MPFFQPMPKKKPLVSTETRKQSRLREREREQQRVLFIALGVVAALVLIILAFGYWRTTIAILDETIATVNNVPLKVRDYQVKARYEAQVILSRMSQIQEQAQQFDENDPSMAQILQYFESQYAQEQTRLLQVPGQALESLIDDELVRQEAAKRGITVSAQEIDREIELAIKENLGYARPSATPTDGPSPTPTHTRTATLTPTNTATPSVSPTATATLSDTLNISPTPDATATMVDTPTPLPTQTPLGPEAYATEVAKLQENVNNSRYTFDDYRKIVEINLLRAKLNEALAKEVTATAEQIHVRHILVETAEEAQKILERLNAGEDFEKLAQELSTDPSAKSNNGDLGWAARGTYVTEFEEAAWALTNPLQLSEPVTTTFGVHLIQLIEKDANRPLEGQALENKRASALSDWIAQARVAAGTTIQRFFNTEYVPSEIRRLQSTTQ